MICKLNMLDNLIEELKKEIFSYEKIIKLINEKIDGELQKNSSNSFESSGDRRWSELIIMAWSKDIVCKYHELNLLKDQIKILEDKKKEIEG